MTDPLTLPNQPSPSPQAKTQAAAASRALLFGNLVIGIGVMVVPGMLEQLPLI
jgi:hypothetical protein